ncbi:MAG: hypothetical protein CMF43_05315 [Legionellales bacterium]|nr:hypothetical protein [Legionellales bacterium]|tara:strand:+ start:1512 stop:2963 length:1452 start_codon:yes stop_codon:yes gene_type:complete
MKATDGPDDKSRERTQSQQKGDKKESSDVNSHHSDDELEKADAANHESDETASNRSSAVTDSEYDTNTPPGGTTPTSPVTTESDYVSSDTGTDHEVSSPRPETKQLLKSGFKTPPRTGSVLKKKDSPYGTSQPEDSNLDSSKFDNRDFITDLFNIKMDFSQFLQSSVFSDSEPLPFNRIVIKENSQSAPFNRVGINTHSDFCDRNPTYRDKSPRSLHRLVQCCAALTRNIDMSMVFLNHGNKNKIACYPRFKTSIDGSDQVRIYTLTERLERLSDGFMETYKNLKISEVNVKDGLGNMITKKRSLIVNVGLITVCDIGVTPPREKNVAIITGNGQFKWEEQEFDQHLRAIQECIQRIDPDIKTYRALAKNTPVANAHMFHCESLCAELIGMRADVLHNRIGRDKRSQKVGNPGPLWGSNANETSSNEGVWKVAGTHKKNRVPTVNSAWKRNQRSVKGGAESKSRINNQKGQNQRQKSEPKMDR